MSNQLPILKPSLVIALLVILALITVFSRPNAPVPPVIPIVPLATTTTTIPPEVPRQPAAQSVLLDVPFTAQAPFAQWSDPRQQDACEEAVSLMAVKWAKSEKIAGREEARAEILAITQFEQEKYNGERDTSAQDTAKRIINDYYQYPQAQVLTVNSAQDLIDQLRLGHLVIVPANGRALGNPYFTQPGPERHMLVIKGFNLKTSEFITNDPGVRQGENYRYPINVLFNAIRDYPTGSHVPITTIEKKMIVVSK